MMIEKNIKMTIAGVKVLFSLIIPCSLLLTISSCSTDEDFFYQDEPRVRLVGEKIWAAGTDSVSFSFVAYQSSVVEKDIYVDAQIMGDVASHDRTVKLAVDQEKTTASATQ